MDSKHRCSVSLCVVDSRVIFFLNFHLYPQLINMFAELNHWAFSCASLEILVTSALAL